MDKWHWLRKASVILLLLLVAGATVSRRQVTVEAGTGGEGTAAAVDYSFAIVADMRSYAGPAYDTTHYFRGAVETISGLDTDFTVSPGDIDPPSDVLWTITRTLGLTYTWYPVMGNHELPGLGSEPSHGANLAWLQGYDYGTVNPGPSGCPTTTYSLDYQDLHLVFLNEYCDVSGPDATTGDIPNHLYDWLVADLAATTQPTVLVFGHEPAYPQPDADNGRLRHAYDSLNEHPTRRDRFWQLLRDRDVAAYICGHTHNYSAVRFDGVWQIDVGHARGLGDTGARSTVVVVRGSKGNVLFDVYRDDAQGGAYALMHQGLLVGTEWSWLPLVIREAP